MSSKQLRQQAYDRQHQQCYYCEFPIWNTDRAAFLRGYPLLARYADHLQCTAEHLVARQDGGKDTADNIVAACSVCNRWRHHYRPGKAPDAASYKEKVMCRVALGKWHPWR